MAEGNEAQLVVDETNCPHPPLYLQPGEVESKATPEGKPVAALPLPTYEQSQKFEQDGVLELVVEQEPEQHMRSQLVAKKPPGTCLDFTLFCLLCAVFGFVGFIFSLCLAFTVAAESGALVGFGTALIFKLFAFETYDAEVIKTNFYHSGCETYFAYGQTKEQCMHRLFYLTRLLFWFVGIFGVLLVCRGFRMYIVSRKAPPSPQAAVDDSDIE